METMGSLLEVYLVCRAYGGYAHRPQSGSFLGLPYRILNMNPRKELLWDYG